MTGQDRAFIGIVNQRADQVLANPYGDRTLNSWLNPAAFALPAPGTLGNFRRNSVTGPAFWSVDAALSRRHAIGTRQILELRVESFNLFNRFNWGPPAESVIPGRVNANFSSPAFGRITKMAGAPRIMQFGVKYGF